MVPVNNPTSSGVEDKLTRIRAEFWRFSTVFDEIQTTYRKSWLIWDDAAGSEFVQFSKNIPLNAPLRPWWWERNVRLENLTALFLNGIVYTRFVPREGTKARKRTEKYTVINGVPMVAKQCHHLERGRKGLAN